MLQFRYLGQDIRLRTPGRPRLQHALQHKVAEYSAAQRLSQEEEEDKEEEVRTLYRA